MEKENQFSGASSFVTADGSPDAHDGQAAAVGHASVAGNEARGGARPKQSSRGGDPAQQNLTEEEKAGRAERARKGQQNTLLAASNSPADEEINDLARRLAALDCTASSQLHGHQSSSSKTTDVPLGSREEEEEGSGGMTPSSSGNVSDYVPLIDYVEQLLHRAAELPPSDELPVESPSDSSDLELPRRPSNTSQERDNSHAARGDAGGGEFVGFDGGQNSSHEVRGDQAHYRWATGRRERAAASTSHGNEPRSVTAEAYRQAARMWREGNTTPPPTYAAAVGAAESRPSQGDLRRVRSLSPGENPASSGWSLPGHRQARATEGIEELLGDYELRTSRPSANLCESLVPTDHPTFTESVPPAVIRGRPASPPDSDHGSVGVPSSATSSGELPVVLTNHRACSEILHPRLRRERHLREFTADISAAVLRHAYHAGRVFRDVLERASHERRWAQFENTTAGRQLREALIDAINEHRLCSVALHVHKWLSISRGADQICLGSILNENSDFLVRLGLGHLAWELNPLHYRPRDRSEPWIHLRPSWGERTETEVTSPLSIVHCRGCGHRSDFV